jgi:hypothetical protein
MLTIDTIIGLKTKMSILAERGFDPRTSGLWAQHASTAPLCFFEFKKCIGPDL